MRLLRSHRPSQAGFTLVEMLVATAILTVLILLIGQIIGVTSQSSAVSSKRLDSTQQARVTLDWIGSDFAGRLKRNDVAHGCTKIDGNDVIAFYSEVESYNGSRRVGAVGYRVEEADGTRGQQFRLERAVRGAQWSDDGSTLFSSTFPAIDPGDYETLADGVLRMEFCYLKNDGTLSNTASANLEDVSAIVVALAILDGTSRKVIGPADLATLAAALPDNAEGVDPISGWNAAYAAEGFATGLPRPAIEGLRFTQRYFYVR